MFLRNCQFWVLALVFIAGWGADAFAFGAWDQMVLYVREQQQAFHRELASALRLVQEGGGLAAWGLITVSFLYGVFHAAGPGHGKAIIGTYVATHESHFKRAVALSFAAALAQGVTAVVVVLGVMFVIEGTSRQAQEMAQIMEQAGFLMIAGVGLVLMYRAGKILYRRLQTKPVTHHHHDHDHDHHHDDHHGHHHHDHSGACQVCGHSHAPDPVALEGGSWRDTVGIIVSIGIRPCSGSVLVMIFAHLIGLTAAGIASVFAVSIGTAITVSGLAFVAMFMRKTALRLTQGRGSQTAETGFIAFALLGGGIITYLGWSLFMQTYSTAHPLF